MHWRKVDDGGVQNRNAGNGGDLVKHTVYLATLRYLLKQVPWSAGLSLHECHAGRGVYFIPASHNWRPLLLDLHRVPVGQPVFLRDAQSDALSKLRCWPEHTGDLGWYAGSALMNASLLASDGGEHSVELYEYDPITRSILDSAIEDSGIRRRVTVSALSAGSDAAFDGEEHILQNIGNWVERDIVLLDPFAMWRKGEHQKRRDRYAAILDQLTLCADPRPSMLMFCTWGSDNISAVEDVTGTGRNEVRNGYQCLRRKLHSAGLHFVHVQWCWGYRFALWAVVPGEHLGPLQRALHSACGTLARHLKGRWTHADVSVEID